MQLLRIIVKETNGQVFAIYLLQRVKFELKAKEDHLPGEKMIKKLKWSNSGLAVIVLLNQKSICRLCLQTNI